jgi:ubiquinone/menaquinone biosynthesis C-methylase UbiE
MTKSSPIRLFYDEWASLYDAQPTPATAAERSTFLSFVSPKKTDLILEIGCGTGRITIPLAKNCKQIIGVDFSDRMLVIAKKKFLGMAIHKFQK